MRSSIEFEKLPIELQWKIEQQRRRNEALADWLTAIFVTGCTLVVTVPQLNQWGDRLLSLPASQQQQRTEDKSSDSGTLHGYTFPLPGRKGQKPVSIPGDCRPLGSCTRRHAGADYGAPVGSPVVAVKGGTVVEVNPDASVGGILGIKADDGEVFRYVHMSRDSVRRWKIGDKVSEGQKILSVGYEEGKNGEPSPWGSGPHLHVERYFKNGQLDSKVHVWLLGAK